MVADLARLLHPDATIHVRRNVDGPDDNREVDVEIRSNAEGQKQFLLLECKDWNEKVDVSAIDGLHSKSLDLEPDLTIIYSNSGFTKMALDKARRLGIGAMSALRAGDQRIRYIAERLFVAKALLVTRFTLSIFPTDASTGNIPPHWEPTDLYYQGQPVVNWLSSLSRDLLQQHPDAKEMVWSAAFVKEAEFAISGQAVILRGLQLTLECSQKNVSQVVREDVTAGAFDHVQRCVIIPDSQSYILGSFGREAWEDYAGTPDEAQELPPNTVSINMVFIKPIPSVPSAGTPALSELLNPNEQRVATK